MNEWELVGQDNYKWKFAQRGGWGEVTIDKNPNCSDRGPLPRIRNGNRVFIPTDDYGNYWDEWELSQTPLRLNSGVSQYNIN